MTRENKLAMVVGFGLLLFVGILVSDHFSTAQRQGSANLAVVDRSGARISRPISIAPVAGSSAAQPAEAMASNQTLDVRPASIPSTAPAQAVAQDNAKSGVRPISNIPGATAGATPGASLGAAPETVVAATAPVNNQTAKVQESEPGVRLHPIAEGETLYSICAKEYGNGLLWKELAEYNKKTLPNAAKLRKGVTLRLPPVEQLRRGAVLASSTKGARVSATPQEQEGAALKGATIPTTKIVDQVPLLTAAGIESVELAPVQGGMRNGVIEVAAVKTQATAAKSTTPSSGKQTGSSAPSITYVVQKGDTLSSIAKSKLGKTSRWKEIAEANGSTLSNPAELSPGMTIQIPQTN